MAEQGWQGRGSTRAWRVKRKGVLARGRCELALEGCTTKATVVHHLSAWSGRPEDVPDHLLAAACAECNSKVGNPTRHDPAPRGGTRW